MRREWRLLRREVDDAAVAALIDEPRGDRRLLVEGAGTRPPRLVERIKVDLPRLRVGFFDYGGDYEPQALEGDREVYFQR